MGPEIKIPFKGVNGDTPYLQHQNAINQFVQIHLKLILLKGQNGNSKLKVSSEVLKSHAYVKWNKYSHFKLSIFYIYPCSFNMVGATIPFLFALKKSTNGVKWSNP